MQKASDKEFSALKLVAILSAAIIATGCVSAKSKPTQVAEPAEPAEEVESDSSWQQQLNQNR